MSLPIDCVRATILADPIGRLRSAAEEVVTLALATEAAKGHDNVFGLLRARVAILADVLWVIESEAPAAAKRGMDLAPFLYIMPVLLLAMEAGPEDKVLSERECVAGCLKGTPAWDWCTSLARQLAGDVRAELERAVEPEEVAHA
ncbi:MAG TPA: hypothetical protein VLH75_20555 [Longimicrobiales bacterium]|nr:hypothetical protein [Longimicrobiales bacterium]